MTLDRKTVELRSTGSPFDFAQGRLGRLYPYEYFCNPKHPAVRNASVRPL